MGTKRVVIRYLLCPGYVTSKNDGDSHYITAQMLARLYRVRIEECKVRSDTREGLRGERIGADKHLIKLYPCYDGNYRLTKGVK